MLAARIAKFILLSMIIVWPGLKTNICRAQEQTFNLDAIITMALERNPTITATREQINASQAQLTQSKSGYLPQVSANAAAGRQRSWTPPVGIPEGIHAEANNYAANLGVSQYIYDFGKTDNRVEQSRQNLAASHNNLRQTTAVILRNVIWQYYEVIKAGRLVEVDKEALAVRQQHLAQAKAFFKAGIRPKIDVTKAEVEVARARVNLIRTRFNLETAYVNLENAIGGKPAPGAYTLLDEQADTISGNILPQPLIELAQEQRPEISRITNQISASQAALKAAQAGNRPAITADAGYGYQNSEWPLEDQWQVGVNLDWPLFSGFRTKGEVMEARANFAQLQAQFTELELQIIQEVTSAAINVNESVEEIYASEVALRNSEENMALADGRYRAGVGTAIEYSDAALDLTQSKSNLVQARYRYLQYRADLNYATGSLPLP